MSKEIETLVSDLIGSQEADPLAQFYDTLVENMLEVPAGEVQAYLDEVSLELNEEFGEDNESTIYIGATEIVYQFRVNSGI